MTLGMGLFQRSKKEKRATSGRHGWRAEMCETHHSKYLVYIWKVSSVFVETTAKTSRHQANAERCVGQSKRQESVGPCVRHHGFESCQEQFVRLMWQ